jgi:fused signal recognition particle receptor
MLVWVFNYVFHSFSVAQGSEQEDRDRMQEDLVRLQSDRQSMKELYDSLARQHTDEVDRLRGELARQERENAAILKAEQAQVEQEHQRLEELKQLSQQKELQYQESMMARERELHAEAAANLLRMETELKAKEEELARERATRSAIENAKAEAEHQSLLALMDNERNAQTAAAQKLAEAEDELKRKQYVDSLKRIHCILPIVFSLHISVLNCMLVF